MKTEMFPRARGLLHTVITGPAEMLQKLFFLVLWPVVLFALLIMAIPLIFMLPLVTLTVVGSMLYWLTPSVPRILERFTPIALLRFRGNLDHQSSIEQAESSVSLPIDSEGKKTDSAG